MSRESNHSPLAALLGFLMFGPRHPYELHQEFDRELGRVWYVGQSHLYAHLKQLAESGLVAVKVEVQDNRPARHVYHLLPTGEAEFLKWLCQPTPHVRDIRLEFLTRFYFFRRLALPGLPQLVAEQQAILRDRLASLDHAMAETDDDYWRLVLDFRRSEIQAIIGWLDRCLMAS